MMALFVAVAGAIIVGLAYISKRRFHRSMEEQRAEEAAFREEAEKFRAEEVAAMAAKVKENPAAAESSEGLLGRAMGVREALLHGNRLVMLGEPPYSVGSAFRRISLPSGVFLIDEVFGPPVESYQAARKPIRRAATPEKPTKR
ncbi:hypothetical protein RFM23_27955 [Mesorhizobium abyssinicae]|uniref:Uncharacterized protein n=1 Tax=Mesorhizobium abyssinicae TaxID=1209958 RepID=A0ABU5AVW4_9HYPH|nr:hypothetical protein [Mesorhizobium abyssinicae]MDX8541462.1 hypothetical protein [Mesorhizobium abyssinicae]